MTMPQSFHCVEHRHPLEYAIGAGEHRCPEPGCRTFARWDPDRGRVTVSTGDVLDWGHVPTAWWSRPATAREA